MKLDRRLRDLHLQCDFLIAQSPDQAVKRLKLPRRQVGAVLAHFEFCFHFSSALPFDVDRDGRVNLLVTHVTEPPALLHNQTETPYGSTSIELIGTSDVRDAYGAIATLHFANGGVHPERTQIRQRLAGNGYLISTGDELRFSFGPHQRASALTIDWRDGTIQSFPAPEVGHRYVCIQGQGLHDLGVSD